MKKNRIYTVIIIVFALLFGHTIGHTAETKIFVRFSVGGAVLVGGGVLYWYISKGTRVSQNPSPSEESDKSIALVDNKTKQIEFLSVDQRDELTSFKKPSLYFHIPIYVCNW